MPDDKERRGPRFVRVRRRAAGGPPETPAEVPPEPPPPPASDVHTRLVVPRARREEEARPGPEADIELREVRYGATSRGPYLRVVPRQRRLTRVAPGHLEATQLGSRPTDVIGRYWADIKRVFIGSPFATSQAIHERLSKVKALAVLGSDPLSSSAYATEEALLILALAGTSAFVYSLPIAAVVALLMIIVVVSYSQTQKAYPSGGGAYIVAHENLGGLPGVTAGSALIVDYVLLVSVSVAAGVAAITSAVPDLLDWRVPLSVVIVAFFTLGNLRGIRESGTLFAAPTYFFISAMGGVVALGLVKVLIGDAPGSLLHAAPPREEVVATQGLTLWLVLRAFSSGGAALTGVEAMSNNIPNFKPPESTNARKTLAVMAIIAIYLFIGITFLSSRFGLVPTEDETIVSQLGRVVLGENVLYYAYQAATALVLFLAANTSFYDFPLLSAILSRDKYAPRQFGFRGDRLAYSNGIIVLAGAATLLLIVFQAEVTRLIPLYAVGVFVSFTLSQSGMVQHWLRLKEPGWKVSLVINGVGAVATGVVAVIITGTKFVHGAWISLLMMAVLMGLMVLIRRHYAGVEWELKVDEEALRRRAPPPIPPTAERPREHVIVPVDTINRITAAAVEFARETSNRVTAVHITDDRAAAEEFRERWQRAVPDVPLIIVESPYRAFVAPMLTYVESVEAAEPRAPIVVVLPRLVPRRWWERYLHNRDISRLRPYLQKRPRVRPVDFPYRLAEKSKLPA
jgi:amino acid transporter